MPDTLDDWYPMLGSRKSASMLKRFLTASKPAFRFSSEIDEGQANEWQARLQIVDLRAVGDVTALIG
jgi:hypothetical protein